MSVLWLCLPRAWDLRRPDLHPLHSSSECHGETYIRLAKFVENEEWEQILAFTKLYDLSFRKVSHPST